MRIAYVCYWNLERDDGVTEKIRSQIGRWRSAGHDVDVLTLVHDPDRPTSGARFADEYRFDGGWSRFSATTRLAGAARSLKPDLVYLRYDVFLPTILRAFGEAKLVLELNSNVTAELRRRSSPATAYELLQRRMLLRRADGAVAVTSELARAATNARPGLVSTVIANGVELGPVPAPEHDGGSPRLVYVGEDVYWQGVDKLVELAERFPEWRFDVVGSTTRAFPANVTRHGFLAKDGYARVLASADVAVGTLALHRKDMDEASPLKVRRYLEFGLPVILAYDDTDLAGVDAWWLLKLPNVESNVRDSIPAIETFVMSAAGRRVPRADVESRISAESKERRRLEFFAEVVGQAEPDRSAS
jgi:glycosyltransferase involved in cell wall biosynthesis